MTLLRCPLLALHSLPRKLITHNHQSLCALASYSSPSFSPQGGASIRFRLFDSTLCFVCAHLAAHRNAVSQRNADFASIMTKTEFTDEGGRGEAAAAAGRAGQQFAYGLHGGTAGGGDGSLHPGANIQREGVAVKLPYAVLALFPLPSPPSSTDN